MYKKTFLLFIEKFTNLQIIYNDLHCKKSLAIFSARESLVRDIPAGEEKIANFFLQCMHHACMGLSENGVVLTVSPRADLRNINS